MLIIQELKPIIKLRKEKTKVIKAYCLKGKSIPMNTSDLNGKTKGKHHKIYEKVKFYERSNKKIAFRDAAERTVVGRVYSFNVMASLK